MNKNITKNILIQSTKSYDKINESKKSSKPTIKFQDFLHDFFKDSDVTNLNKYIVNK